MNAQLKLDSLSFGVFGVCVLPRNPTNQTPPPAMICFINRLEEGKKKTLDRNERRYRAGEDSCCAAQRRRRSVRGFVRGRSRPGPRAASRVYPDARP